MKSMKTKQKNNFIKNKYKIVIDFENELNAHFDFDAILLIKKILKKTLIIENVPYDVSINVSLVSKQKIRALNKKNRNINKSTDVLSFPNISFKSASNFDSYLIKKNDNIDIVFPYNLNIAILDFNNKTVFLGDIVLCYDKIISQANEYNHSIKREFAFLVLHSLLHLLGYDHIKKCDEKIMFDKQKYILNELKIIK